MNECCAGQSWPLNLFKCWAEACTIFRFTLLALWENAGKKNKYIYIYIYIYTNTQPYMCIDIYTHLYREVRLWDKRNRHTSRTYIELILLLTHWSHIWTQHRSEKKTSGYAGAARQVFLGEWLQKLVCHFVETYYVLHNDHQIQTVWNSGVIVYATWITHRKPTD